MNSDQLKKFLVITNCKSMSEAADVLFITQSALSHSIAELEDELGCKLFTREKKKLILTSNGEDLLRYARAVTQLMSQAKETLVANSTLRISAINVCAAYMLQNYPDELLTNVNLIQLDESEMPIAIRRELIDIAACDDFYFRHERIIGLEKFLLCRERLVLRVPKGHKFYNLDSISIQELEKEPISIRTDFPSLTTWVQNVQRVTGVKINIAFSMDRFTFEFLGNKLPYPEIRLMSSIFRVNRAPEREDIYHYINVTGTYTNRYIYIWYLEGNKKKVSSLIDSVKALYSSTKAEIDYDKRITERQKKRDL